MNQRGFATLEVILMVMVIGILASIAVPRFTNVTTRANTAKIQADLSTIDTAIAVYQMEQGDNQTIANVAALVSAGYLQGEPQPPSSGSCYHKEGSGEPTSKAISTLGASYTIEDITISGSGDSAVKVKRAVLGTGNTADKFYAPKS